MNRRLIAINAQELYLNTAVWKCICDKELFPLLDGKEHIDGVEELTFKYLRRDNKVYVSEHPCRVQEYKKLKGFRIPSDIIQDFIENCKNSEYLFISIEGTGPALVAIAIFTGSDRSCFDEITSNDGTLRLDAFDLPPIRATAISSPDVLIAIYKWLGRNYSELFSINTHQFLNSPHVLASLFEPGLNSEVHHPSVGSHASPSCQGMITQFGRSGESGGISQ